MVADTTEPRKTVTLEEMSAGVSKPRLVVMTDLVAFKLSSSTTLVTLG